MHHQLRRRGLSVAVLLAAPVHHGAVLVARLPAVFDGPAGSAVPRLFRFTCYYYRGAYYKAFWADPPACTVGEPRKTYWGERTFPLILQNVHRYFLYFAIALIFILALRRLEVAVVTPTARHFGIGVGSLVLIVNPILLALYTFGCHSFRHLIGGRLDEISKSPVRKSCYDCASSLNRRHMLWAWFSMFFGGLRGPLRAPLFDGRLDRLENLLTHGRLSGT